jgi:hypothetical protein
MIARIIFTCFFFIHFSFAQAQKTERIISFSGYEWLVRNTTEKQGPGPNYFSDSCVRLDAKGWLHLLIKKDVTTGAWICPEITSVKKFGFGEYGFIVEGAIDRFDKNIVLGLFNYSGNDGLDEMDIEIARWGNAAYPNLNYTIWPANKEGVKNSSTTHEFSLKSNLSYHCFRRNADTVICSSFDGTSADAGKMIFSSTFVNPASSISQLDMPVHINFWLFDGNPPADEHPVEIVIRNFRFIP